MQQLPLLSKPKKTVTLRARCSESLRAQLLLLANLKEADLSDVIREACRSYVTDHQDRAR